MRTYSNGYPLDYLWPRYIKKNGELVLNKSFCPIIEGSYLYKYSQKGLIRALFYWIILISPKTCLN